MISWLESTTGAQSQSWTKSGSASNAEGADAAGVARSFRSSFSYEANYSRTASTYSEVSKATNSLFFNKQTIDRTFAQSGATFLTTTNSEFFSEVFGAEGTSGTEDSNSNLVTALMTGALTGRTSNVSILSTRGIQTSTTQTYATNISSTSATTRSVQIWSTSTSATDAAPVFYSASQSVSANKTITTTQQRTRDTTTTQGTEIDYGLDNTIWQCRTSDFSAEIAWTAPNSFTLSDYAISSFAATNSVTRWTESRNSATIAASLAGKTQFPYTSPPPQTLSVAGLTSEIPYTTTIAGTFAQTTETDGVFPVVTFTQELTQQTTEASTSSITYYSPETFTTIYGISDIDDDNDTAYSVPTFQTQEWYASRKTYTTGNGTITWHEFADVPATRYRTTQNNVANPGNQIAATYAPALLYGGSRADEDNGTFWQTAGGITMALSAKQSAGVATTKANAISVSVFGPVGSVIDQTTGALANIALGKTFTQPNITAWNNRATAQTTIFPSSYAIADTDGAWSGTIRISGKSASANFVPTDTGQETTSTSGQFSAVHAAQTSAITERANLVGGNLANGETLFAKWQNGLFAGTSGTSSSTASVVSQTAAAAPSFYEPIVGLAPDTQINSRTVVSYTQLRNAAIMPPISYA